MNLNNLILLAVILMVADVSLCVFAPEWRRYKLIWLKREVWLLFGRCPRCNTPVNWTRNKQAVCPECGRRA